MVEKKKFKKIILNTRLYDKEFFLYLIKEKLPKNITEKEWVLLFKNKSSTYIWEFLLEKKLENFYNFIVTLQFCMLFFDFSLPLTKYEELVYKDKKTFEVSYLMLKTVERLLSDNFNEMIKKDLDIIKNDSIWVGLNLDSFYFIGLPHINHDDLTKKKKKKNLSEKIIDVNIIISTLERIKEVVFYTKLHKKDENIYPETLLESLSYTKGYLICFSPKIVPYLKKYKYMRKLIKRKPLFIKTPEKKKLTFLESLDDNNFSTPIWMNNRNFNIVNDKNLNVYNRKLLEAPSNIENCVSNLNYLNSIEFFYDKFFFESLLKIIDSSNNIDKSLSTRASLYNTVLKINNNKDEGFTEINTDLPVLIQSASVLELIKTQLTYYDSFYFDNRLCSRIRVYPYPWPINYQLNHVIRNILLFKKKEDVDLLWEKFWGFGLVRKYLKDTSIFEYDINLDIKTKIDNLFIKNSIESSTTVQEKLKKESIYQLLIKISPKEIKNLNDKIDFSLGILEDFIGSNLEKDWKVWLDKIKLKKKKLPYLLNYQIALKNALNNNFSSVLWADASSNAIQLIVLRLNIKHPMLLKLVNIYDNDTGFSNIYEYITIKIKELNHKKIIKDLENILTKEQINFLQDIDNNKYLLMPSAYGMGKITYRKKLNEMLQADEREGIWNLLNDRQKNILSDYFWESAVKILKKVGFNMNEYKSICKNFSDTYGSDCFIWKTDLGVTIGPVSLKTSKREEILKKLNFLKLKIKETKDEEALRKLMNEVEKYKKKLSKNEKDFYKRTMVKTSKHKIFCRLYFKEKYDVNGRETQQTLVPNTIHAYDASIVHLCIKICKILKINLMVIHDSIGCNMLVLVFIKMIFKIVNVFFIDINNKKEIFPLYNKKKLKENELLELIKNILKSKNFFH